MESPDSTNGSLARVLRSTNPEDLAGTAFLFRQDGDRQYWFTCHHVIMDLPDIWIAVEINGEWQPHLAEYDVGRSRPKRDVAVITTRLSQWGHLLPFKMGDPYAAKRNVPPHERLLLVGFAKDDKSKPVRQCEIPSDFRPCGPYEYRLRRGDAPRPSSRSPGHPWNCDPSCTESIRTYEICNGRHLAPGVSGSPVCYSTQDGEGVCLGMFSQIWRNPLGEPEIGIVLKYQDLFDSAGTLIPFYPYTDCVVITVAATRHEMIQHQPPAIDSGIVPAWWAQVANPDYYGDMRDQWRPFGRSSQDQPPVIELLKSAADGWQVASAYVPEPGVLRDIFSEPVGVLFLVDPCSLHIRTLQEVIAFANQVVGKSSYMYLLCEERPQGTNPRPALKEHFHSKLPNVSGTKGCSIDRYDEVSDIAGFKRAVGRLIYESYVLVMYGVSASSSFLRGRIARERDRTNPDIEFFPRSTRGFWQEPL